MGSRFGVEVATAKDTAHPVDWLVTETLLHGFRGNADNVPYFKSTPSLGFDPKKNFTLDLSYSTGRREDTGEVEKGWNIAFGAKY